MHQQIHSAAQTIVITGGNTGLGYQCARSVAAARPDWQIVIASRNPNAPAAARQISAETGNAHVTVLPLDLASLASIRAFATQLAASDLPPLRAIVCNAGIQIVTGTRYTSDGFETTFGVNHLGHFLLLNLLLPQMSVPGRIVLVSSGTHDPNEPTARMIGGYAPRFRDVQALACPNRFPNPAERGESAVLTGRHRYGTSKLCNLLCAYELARRLQAGAFGDVHHATTANAFDPGLMPGTGLAREADALTRFAWNRLLPLLNDRVAGINSVCVSGENLARLVLDPAVAALTGAYIVGQAEARSSDESYDQAKAQQLWDGSQALVDLQAAVRASSGAMLAA